MFDEKLIEALRESGVIPVIVLEDPGRGVALAEAFLRADLRVMEITFRAKGAAEAIRSIRAACPEMRVGAGTLITPGQVRAATEAGASFGVAPGCNPEVVQAAADCRLPFAPGVMTPSDVERALGLGCRVLKFFPAESSGGVAHLKGLSAPYRHYDIHYLPTGGIDATKAVDYLALPEVPAVGGSWLAPGQWIREENWEGIETLARDSIAALKKQGKQKKEQAI